MLPGLFYAQNHFDWSNRTTITVAMKTSHKAGPKIINELSLRIARRGSDKYKRFSFGSPVLSWKKNLPFIRKLLLS
jgi:hypothetical protein